MITKDKIEEAVDEFIGHAPDVDEGVETIRCRKGFRGGVEWFRQAIWHDVSEFPDKYGYYLVMNKSGHIELLNYWSGSWIDLWKDRVSKWCDLKDILPKE